MPILFIDQNGRPIELNQIEIDEGQLRDLFEKHAEKLFEERGLRIVGRNVKVDEGYVDTLAVDASNRPTIVEYKVRAATSNALVQALSYRHNLIKDQTIVSNVIKEKIPEINPKQLNFSETRIILVAPGFLKHLLNVVESIASAGFLVTLIQYTFFRSDGNIVVMAEKLFDIPEGGRSTAQYTIDSFFVGSYQAMKPIFDELSKRVKSALGIEPYATYNYIAFKRNGSVFLQVFVYVSKIVVGLALPGEQLSSARYYLKRKTEGWGPRITHCVKLTKTEDIDEDLIEKIKKSYELLKYA